jgi:Putative peptidoglycan binding domain
VKWNGFCGDYNGCRQTNAPEVDDSPPSYKLTAPVGAPPRSRNLSGDVYEVQRALNRFSPIDGGPSPPLVVDSICGSKTIAAIRNFQLKKFGWSGADGVVDPGQQTERALFGNSPGNPYIHGGPDGPKASSPVSPATEMYANIARALSIINITRSQISSARVFRMGGSSLGFGEGAWNKLVKHFQIDKFKNWEKTLSDIDRIYSDMQTAIGYVPQGVVLFVDQSPTSTRGAYAWAVSGGYSLERRQLEDHDEWPPGSILVMQKMRTLKSDAYAYVLIHELAHYVGPVSPDIVDYAYHRDPAKYAALWPEQRIRNADCYSQFAFDAIGKPFKHSEHQL